jgi:predicted P-loop ATPase
MDTRGPIAPEEPVNVHSFRPKAARNGKPRPAAPSASWLAGALRDHRDEPIPNLANALIALRTAPELQGIFGYDEMQCATITLREPPSKDGTPGIECEPRPTTDVDVGRVQEFIQRNGLPRLGKDTTHQACDLHAAENAFHPVKDYLNSLRWDGKLRLKTWLARYLGAQENAYVSGIGTMFMVALVARIFEPGCKADYMVVLEGEQGARKSTACSILGGEWFSDNLPDVTAGKDVSQHLPGKWLIEIGEMAAMSKVESEALKAFITRPVERYRKSYARKESVEPRQCVFIGTTNKKTYLRDETGGRRFWPVTVSKIDTDALRADRDQLFAEAVEHYRQGTRWWPDADFEAEHIRPEQEARFEADVWEESVNSYIEARTTVLVGEVAREALNIDKGKIGRADQLRITAALERAGWRRGKKDWRGNIPWIRGTAA